jgi:uncharacterized protein
MIKIYIKGLKDGLHDVELSEPVNAVPELSEEFFGDIEIKGKLRVLGNRFNLVGSAICKAKLICDRTLKEFEQDIVAELTLAYLVNSTGIEIVGMDDNDKERMISKEEKYLDITDDVREELIISIPMKKVAPDIEDKDFEDIYPEHSATKNKKVDKDIDDRWSALKDIKIN